jgi:hypothetical protein
VCFAKYLKKLTIIRTDWPMITKKHDDIGQAFLDRMARDQCSPILTWNYDEYVQNIVSVTLTTALQNRCKVPIPVTIPVNAANPLPPGTTTEQLGSDPLTLWLKMTGSPVTVYLAEPIPL